MKSTKLLILLSIVVCISLISYEYWINFTSSGLYWKSRRIRRKIIYIKDKNKEAKYIEKLLQTYQAIISKFPKTSKAVFSISNIGMIYSRFGLHTLGIEKQRGFLLTLDWSKPWFKYTNSVLNYRIKEREENFLQIDEILEQRDNIKTVILGDKILTKQNILNEYNVLIEKYKDTEEEAWIRIELGRFYMGLNDFFNAISEYQRAKEIFVFLNRSEYLSVIEQYIQFSKQEMYR